MNLVQNIAHRVVTADLSQFPHSVVEKGKYCILDAVGCGLYGQEFEATRVLQQPVEEWNGRTDSSILGKRLKVPSVFAARVNGTAIHVADFDDSSVHFKGHPTGVILPSTLALCERESMSGRAMLQARGGPSSPLTVDEIRKKFRTCAGRSLSGERIDSATELILSLETLQKISSLTEMLRLPESS